MGLAQGPALVRVKTGGFCVGRCLVRRRPAKPRDTTTRPARRRQGCLENIDRETGAVGVGVDPAILRPHQGFDIQRAPRRKTGDAVPTNLHQFFGADRGVHVHFRGRGDGAPAMQIQVRYGSLKSAGAVENHRTKPGRQGHRPHQGRITLVPGAINECLRRGCHGSSPSSDVDQTLAKLRLRRWKANRLSRAWRRRRRSLNGPALPVHLGYG